MEKTRLLILRLTEKCNLACRYCYAAHDGAAGDMDIAAAYEAVELMADGCDRINIQFTGGEPLLRADAMEKLYAYIKRRGIRASYAIQTNGTLLDRERRRLLKAMRCSVGVSLDGMCDANMLRVYPDGREAFDDTAEGVRALSMSGIKCNLNAVVSSANADKLDGLVGVAAYFGNVGGVGLDMFRPLGRGRENDFSPDAETLEAGLYKMLKKRETLLALGVNVAIKELSKVEFLLRGGACPESYCFAQTGMSAAMDCKGDFYPCSSFAPLAEYRIGNIRDGAPRDIQERVAALPMDCRACADAPICRGGCPAGRVGRSGVSELDCIMHKTFIKYGREKYV